MAKKDLWGGLLQGFAQAREAKLARQAGEEEKKLKVKLFKQQLEEQEKQQKALDQIQGIMRGVGAPEGPTRERDILDVVSDPAHQTLALQAGMSVQDIADMKQMGKFDQILSGVINKQFGGGTGAPGAPSAGGPTSEPRPGGMELAAIKFDSSGKPMFDFERSKVKEWVPSQNGMEMIGLDEAGQPITSRPMTPGEKPQPTKEEERERDLASALDVYQKAKQGLVEGLEGTVTAPILGKLPALTSEQQIAQGGVAAMAPVLKQLFRAAGEGVFTDRDQALLLEMIPTRETNPKARKAMMDNIDAIVRAKLGMSAAPGSAGSPVQLAPEDEALVNKYLPKR